MVRKRSDVARSAREAPRTRSGMRKRRNECSICAPGTSIDALGRADCTPETSICAPETFICVRQRTNCDLGNLNCALETSERAPETGIFAVDDGKSAAGPSNFTEEAAHPPRRPSRAQPRGQSPALAEDMR